MKARGFTALALLSLGLGIAGVVVMIAVMDAIYFRPLPYRNANRVVVLEEVPPPDSVLATFGTSQATYTDWQVQARSYERTAALRIVPVQLRDEAAGVIDDGAQVSADFFSVLGIAPQLGRTFTVDEVTTGARIVVLSHEVWMAQFGGDPNVVGNTWRGRVLMYGNDPVEGYTIIGVMPRGAALPWRSKVWLPLHATSGTNRARRGLIVLGLLRPGHSVAAADLELKAVTRNLAVEYPAEMGRWSARATALRDWMIGFNPDPTVPRDHARNARLVLLGVTMFVLVIAAANVAALFLGRGLARRHEMVVRVVLGASGARIVSLMLAESLLVSLAGCALGLAVAKYALGIVSARLALGDVGVVAQLDTRVFAASFGVAICTALLVGVLPATTLSGRVLGDGLRVRAPSGRRDRRVGLAKAALVAGQVAAALMLVTGAGLLGRDFVDLTRRAPGYDPHDLVAITLPPALVRRADMPAVVEQTAERLRAIPRVSGIAAYATDLAVAAVRTESGREILGRDVQVNAVSPEFFRTLGIALEHGREFMAGDRAGAPPVAVVNRAAARLLWPGGEAVGERLVLAGRDSNAGGEWVEVVGVARDARVLEDPRNAVRPVVHRPLAQGGGATLGWVTLFARAPSNPESLLSAFDGVVAELHTGSGWQGRGSRLVASDLSQSLSTQRLSAVALAGFSAFGLLLAAMGIYGVVAGMAARRANEIGIRLALGASASHVIWLVTREGAAIAAAGATVGVAASLALARVLQSVLTMTSATDPVVLGSSALLLVAVVLLAAVAPVFRAFRLNPAVILREE